MSISDSTTINGVQLVSIIDGKEAHVRFFAAPFISKDGVHVLNVDEWYRLSQAQPNYERTKRDRDQLRELAPRVREPLTDYVARLDKLQDEHLEACRECSYDHECTACAADHDGDAHDCNCGEMPGYGYQLRNTLVIARLALKGSAR